MNIGYVVGRLGLCFLCLSGFLFLFLSENLPHVFGASHQVCLPTPQGQATIPSAQSGTVLINEVLIFSKQTWSCPGATSVPGTNDQSWVELYNPFSVSFNLYAANASIDAGAGTKQVYFTFGSTIAAHGFITIFINKGYVFSGPETFIRRLFFKDTIIDQITIPSTLQDGQSYARIPDGSSKWKIDNAPSIGRSNFVPTPTPTPKSRSTTKKSHAASIKTKSKSTPTKTPSLRSHTSTSTSLSPAAKNPPTLTSGVQPAWNRLQLPTTTSVLHMPPDPTTASSVDTIANSPPVNNSSPDFTRNIILTSIVFVFAGGLLFWWRRRFKYP